MFSLRKNSGAFTLVELIVVIVILAILATIAFLSFSSQSASARDSTRLSDMSNIAKGLSVFSATSGSFPKPDSFISILASGATIGYQGYAGASVLNMIKISNGGKDPLDNSTYYTYSVNAAQSKFQILGFLEDSGNSALSIGDQTFRLSAFGYQPLAETFADPSSYSGRYVITKGDQLGILLASGSMVPIQAGANTSFTGVDIVKTNVGYTAIFDSIKANQVTGTGVSLGNLASYAKIFKSCKEISDTYTFSGSIGRDGIYQINPDGKYSYSVYCDMTNDGGGWTLIGRIQQSDYMGSQDSFYAGCKGTSLTNCKFGNPIGKSLSVINNNFAFYFDDLTGDYHKMEFLNDGLAPTLTDQYTKGWKKIKTCTGKFSSCADKKAYSGFQTYGTFGDYGYTAPNLLIGPGRVWGVNENDEICDYSCANGGGYVYKTDEIRIWIK